MGRGIATSAVAMLLLAGCGGAEADGEKRLQDFLGGGGGPGQMQAQFEEQQREVEEYIADCMAEEGFEYVPVDHGAMQADVTHPRDEMDEDEFREEYGYGITTVSVTEEIAFDEAHQDPNLEIQEEMDEAELRAYQEALEGEMPDPDPDLEEGGPMQWEPGGCRGEATEEAQGGQRALQQELADDLDRLHQQVQSDPRIVEAEQGWSACIREAGWDLDSPSDVFRYLNEQQLGIQPDDVPEELQDIEPGEEPPPEVAMPEPSQPDPEELAELQAEELELAAADHACQVEHLGEWDEETMQPQLYTEVLAEYEQEFIDEHRDTLEQLRGG